MKVILVEPKYQVNLGYIARTAMNFGIERLYIVSPRAKLGGEKARMYSKHAYALLKHAKVYKSVDDAIGDCSLVIGTTGIAGKAKANFRRIFFAEEAAAIAMKKRGRGTVGLLIGRDDTGLSSGEVEKCDMLAHIETSRDYPILNISHALAIFLFLLKGPELRGAGRGEMAGETAGRGETGELFRLFRRLISKKKIRNKKAVLGVFSRLVRSTRPSRQEIHALITALK